MVGLLHMVRLLVVVQAYQFSPYNGLYNCADLAQSDYCARHFFVTQRHEAIGNVRTVCTGSTRRRSHALSMGDSVT